MKKYFLSLAIASIFFQKGNACGWYDPDYDYFNLFTQSIIKDKSYTPFLLTYSNWFYSQDPTKMPDDNITAWQKYFGNTLSLQETSKLVNTISIAELNQLKNGNPTHPILKKLGTVGYQKYKEGVDYLIEAKYLEPFMMISHVESEDSFYYSEDEKRKNATDIELDKTLNALKGLYASVKNPEIKLRYGFQLVRFLHYNRDYAGSVNAFKIYVEPLKLKSAPYYMALDQYAGALRGLGKKEDANWNFFQVFLNSNRRKEAAFTSMTLSDQKSFDNLLQRATNDREKNMAYFLLGYQAFNNPLPMMEKMYNIDPTSEMLKVLAARAVNELERSYLPEYYYQNGDRDRPSTITKENTKSSTPESPKKELSFWQKFILFFKNLFSSKKSSEPGERTNDLSDKEYLNNPNRIPFLNESEYTSDEEKNNKKDYLENLQKFVDKTKDKSDDEYWKLVDAYLKFLNKDYDESIEVLKNIKTQNPEYLQEISRMNMLNEVVSHPKIDSAFEEVLVTKYIDFFVDQPVVKDSTSYEYEYDLPRTSDFLKDILANRYFLQGDDAKSFLMNNSIADLRYNPNMDLTKKLEAFYNKKDKTTFEQEIISKNLKEIGNPNAFFNLIYGDQEMRNTNFENAKNYYAKASDFRGYELPKERYNYETGEYEKMSNLSELYDGYRNISPLIFGHNVWESYQSPESQSMMMEPFVEEFSFIKPRMNKVELAEALIQLKKIGNGKDERSSKANQLIGNMLYNTSILGYYRETFVADIDNSNGGKYHFNTENSPFKFYYKNYSSNVFIKPDNFDLSISYYQKALQLTQDRENQARILFQMASAEQGKYYQWEANQTKVDWNDKDWESKEKEQALNFDGTKNSKYRTYFTQLKSKYRDTETSKLLMGSCSYYNYFLKK